MLIALDCDSPPMLQLSLWKACSYASCGSYGFCGADGVCSTFSVGSVAVRISIICWIPFFISLLVVSSSLILLYLSISSFIVWAPSILISCRFSFCFFTDVIAELMSSIAFVISFLIFWCSLLSSSRSASCLLGAVDESPSFSPSAFSFCRFSFLYVS